MMSRQLERAVLSLVYPDRHVVDRSLPRSGRAVDAVRAEWARVEQRQRRQALLQGLSRCAAHLMIEGDETED